MQLASSSLLDPGSIANFFMALLMLSPVILILFNVWSHAIGNSGAHRRASWLLAVATLSGLILIPIATDYGRWLSAMTFCNFFAIFFLIRKGLIKVDELVEYSGGNVPFIFLSIIMMYLLFGPFHDWNPYPYRDNIFISSLSIVTVLLIDLGIYFRWRSVSKSTS